MPDQPARVICGANYAGKSKHTMNTIEKACWHLDVHLLHCKKRFAEAQKENLSRLFVDHWSYMVKDIERLKTELQNINNKQHKNE